MAEAALELKERGNELFRAGEYAAAAETYTRALALDDGNAVCRHNRAVCKLRLHDYAGAAEDATRALEAKPDYARALGTLGSALTHLGQHDRATRAYTRA